MPLSDSEPRWFLVQHDCGSGFTLNTSKFIEKFQQGLILRCPNCFEKIDENLLKTLNQFFALYELLVDKLGQYHFTIREIIEQDLELDLEL